MNTRLNIQAVPRPVNAQEEIRQYVPLHIARAPVVRRRVEPWRVLAVIVCLALAAWAFASCGDVDPVTMKGVCSDIANQCAEKHKSDPTCVYKSGLDDSGRPYCGCECKG